jgi:hypothetical protein
MLGHVDRWISSGMAQRDYCTQEGIDYSQFHYWYRVSKGMVAKKRSVTPGFVPIHITEDITVSVVIYQVVRIERVLVYVTYDIFINLFGRYILYIVYLITLILFD